MDFDQNPTNRPPQAPTPHPAPMPQPQQYPYPDPQQQQQYPYPDPQQQYPYPGPQHQPYPVHQHPYYPGPPPQPAPPARTSFGRCMLGALVWVGATVVLIVATAGAPSSGYAAGQVLGRMLFPWLLASFITWLFLRRRQAAFWLATLVALPSFTVLLFLFAAAQLANRA
ncbi:hypothetical protein [Saccharothrix hoggarensis]|uniref:Uncharacterized protein n=1 Tax=Saccharothrix hoggarensis TaxID=913853 RepID=A0ABW3QGU1_9PSEU